MHLDEAAGTVRSLSDTRAPTEQLHRVLLPPARGAHASRREDAVPSLQIHDRGSFISGTAQLWPVGVAASFPGPAGSHGTGSRCWSMQALGGALELSDCWNFHGLRRPGCRAASCPRAAGLPPGSVVWLRCPCRLRSSTAPPTPDFLPVVPAPMLVGGWGALGCTCITSLPSPCSCVLSLSVGQPAGLEATPGR